MTKSQDPKAQPDDSFWDDGTGLVREEPEIKRVYDLEERTARFGEAIIDFAKTIPLNPVTNRIITQLVGAGTSVDANYVEAGDAVSKKDFLKRIGTCRKEARESKHFLRKKTNRDANIQRREAGHHRVRYWGFILLSSFDIRISSFSRI
ncbi:MAG: hypothetical protein DME53_06740 [Verrucomicrobia bacterium]|nr:MAG: hypothetical protein DME53_06740 [Verrucomicrobiota bacterium]